MDDMINNKMDIPNWMATGKPNWMTTGKPILCQKDPGKGNVADNCQPIFCLSFMQKLMTGILANSVYKYLEVYNLIPVEQKECR